MALGPAGDKELFQCKLWEPARFLNYDALSEIIRARGSN
jgi:hypothetical protein